MSKDRDFMKELDRLFRENDGDPEKVFHALEIDGESDDNIDLFSDDEDGDDNVFDFDSAMETIGRFFR